MTSHHARQVSQAYLSAVHARTSAEETVALLRITHPDIDADAWPGGILATDAGEDLVAGGETYLAWAFAWKLPDETGEGLPTVNVRIDNVDPRIARELVRIAGREPAEVEIRAVLRSTPEVTEFGPLAFELQKANDSRGAIEAQLGYEPMLWMTYGRYGFNPLHFPGLFR